MTCDANFAERLFSRACAHPDRVALVEPGAGPSGERGGWSRITFAEAADLVTRYAGGLARVGVRRGDRVLLMTRPSIRTTVTFFALIYLGAVPVLIDPRMGLRRLVGCAAAIEPRVVIAVPAFAALLEAMRWRFGSVQIRITDGAPRLGGGPALASCAAAPPSDPQRVSSGSDEPCFIAYTSGSTGPPKAVPFTHAMVGWQADLLGEATGWRGEMSVVMCFAGFIPHSLASGHTTILPRMDFSRPAAADPRRIAAAIQDHSVEGAFASPTVWRTLARHCRQRGAGLPSLLHAVTAGAPVPPELHARVCDVLHPDGRLHTPYGATEALPLTRADSRSLAGTWEATNRGRGICVGRPLVGIDVSVIRVTEGPVEQWDATWQLPPGEVGEIVAGGPVVSPEYHADPAATAGAKILREGRRLHRTGDLGHIDEDGRIWFCGRVAHRVSTVEGVLAPVQLEAIFDRHPAVRRSALVGVGERGRQKPVLCVELERGARMTRGLESELRVLVEATPFAGVVHSILRHRGFPVDPRHNAKIRREELTAWAGRRLRRSRKVATLSPSPSSPPSRPSRSGSES